MNTNHALTDREIVKLVSLSMVRLKTTSLFIHSAGWILLFIFPLLFMSDIESIGELLTSMYYWQFCLFYIALFYLHTYWIFPFLFFKKRYILYGFAVICLFASVYMLKPFDQLIVHNSFSRREGEPPPGLVPPPRLGKPMHDRPDFRPEPSESVERLPKGDHIDITSIFLFVIMMALSIAIETMYQWRETEKRAVQAEADKISAELSFLKAQIHPHFLFNTLNNIYALAITQNENTATSIMKLSNIMRYVTDEVLEDFVPLSNEVECIRNYIDLQRLRLGKNMQIDFSVNGNQERVKIAPLLLMTFIENVFKYGVSNHHPGSIIIKIVAERQHIYFFCQNQIFTPTQNTNREGVGIVNTRQRLNRLYSDKHSLNIKSEDNVFTVELTLYS
ncbi:sensor histidine kinase [Cytophagaceae bacterium DM2B3-1]|uniref:Sensor histidine kinase n=2 Tax=Xanthocytophaga flava TaxID=3048013 RepID=A0ABT7CN84_9BACT|nr:sensor histidine kinase [Xanthocytophaga flavus]